MASVPVDDARPAHVVATGAASAFMAQGGRSGLAGAGLLPGAGLLQRARAWLSSCTYGPALWLGAVVLAGAAVGVALSVAAGSAQAFARYGPGMMWSSTYSPGTAQYGAGTLVVGTVVTTSLALVLAAPVGLGAAISLSELVPPRVAAIGSATVELFAAVPSIVVGLWALLVLSPLFARDVEPFLRSVPVVGLAFSGPAYGPSILLAAVVLAIMTLPTLVGLSRSALCAVPAEDREAALALGASRWQVVRRVSLPAARSGISAAVTLALGRALGEAIAVALVIGNAPVLPRSLSSPGATLGSAIVNQFAEAQPGLGTSSVIALAAVLLVLTVVVNVAGQLLRRSRPRPAGSPPEPFFDVAEEQNGAGAPPVLLPARSLRRRLALGRLAQGLCLAGLATSAVPLVALVAYTAARAAPALSFGLLVHPVKPLGVPGGGISTAIIGSGRVVGLALAFAMPAGLLAALFLCEHGGRGAGLLRFGADVLSGVPSVVIGIFAFETVVRPMHSPSTLAASAALAVLMLPVMARAGEEAIRAVPVDLQEAAAALGASRGRVVRSVVLAGALPGLAAGNLLALARAAGETAPLLFTLAAPSFAMTLLIYTFGTEPFPSAQQEAWATALVLLGAVLALSALARGAAWYFIRRTR
ncbi:MAG: phosphate ABC transporter permease subunit PstC [Acidimicrobiales bacterium]